MRETKKRGSNRLKVNSVNVVIRQKKAINNLLSVFTHEHTHLLKKKQKSRTHLHIPFAIVASSIYFIT